jgi:hypothetical protein
MLHSHSSNEENVIVRFVHMRHINCSGYLSSTVKGGRAMVDFKKLSRHSSGGTQENHEISVKVNSVLAMI